jgi:hypothetical protein
MNDDDLKESIKLEKITKLKTKIDERSRRFRKDDIE